MKKIIIFFVLLILIGNANSYSIIGSGVCSCNSCSDCMDALNSSVNCYKKVELSVDIDNDSICINNPYNFNNKIFDCNNKYINITGGSEAIYLYGKEYITIQNCDLSGMSIFFVNDSNIKNNKFFKYGLDIFVGDNLLIENNEFNEVYYGLYLEGLKSSEVKSNRFYNNNYSISLVEFNNNNEFFNNIINNSNYYGIRIIDGENNIFNFNKICGSGEYDIYNEGVNNIGDKNICDNTFQWNDKGVYKDCFYSCEIEECFCVNCSDCENKLNTVECKQVKMINNIISENEICINGSNLINFSNKIFDCNNYNINSDNSEIGIYLNENNDITIKDCNIKYFNSAIKIKDSNNIIVDSCNLNLNDYGCYINNSNRVYLLSNQFNQNEINGLYIFNSNNSILTNNNILANKFYGVKIYHSNNMDITGNKIVVNGGGIILSSTADYNELKNNVICYNDYGVTDYFDIHNNGDNNTGDNNVCLSVTGWSDISLTEINPLALGCIRQCADELESIEDIVEEYGGVIEDEDFQDYISNLTGDDNIENFIDSGLKKIGVKGDGEDGGGGGGSTILFCLAIKIIFDIILSANGFSWKSILIINVLVLLLFYVLHLIPLWIPLIILIISFGIFYINIKSN